MRGPRTAGAHAPRAHPIGRAALAPAAETVKSRRWSRKRIALVATPLVIVAIAAALIVPTLLKAKHAYDQIFTDPIPHFQVTKNAAGTPVINPSVTEAAALPNWDKKQRINILLLGVDEDPARLAQGEPPLSDTMILVTVDPVTKQVGMLSIPRDLKVMIPGVGETKINAAYSAGSLSPITGAGLVRTTIETNFHITIHYVVQVNFAGFQKIVDTLGGVTLDVPAPVKDDQYPGQGFNYTRVLFQTGLQHMDGQTALSYARTRHDDSDFGRGNRQQQVLMALRQQAVSLNLITKAPQLLEELGNTFKTDIPPGDMLKLAKLASQVKGDQIHSYNMLSATTVDAPPGQPYYLAPEWGKVHQLLNQMMPPRAGATPTARAATPEPTTTAASAARPDLSAKILVQNATRVNKLAASNAAKLQAAGFTSVDTGQSPETGAYPASRIVVYNGDLASAGLIADTLGLPRSAIVQKGGGGSYDLVVILGDDVAARAGT